MLSCAICSRAETHRRSGTRDALPAQGPSTRGHPTHGSRQRPAGPGGSTGSCFTQPRGEQEQTESGISPDSSFTPISDWQCHQLCAGPARERRLGNTTRTFANNRSRTATRQGVQGPKPPGGVGSARKHTCGNTQDSTHTPAGPPPPSDCAEQPRNHQLSISNYRRATGNHRLPGDSGTDWAIGLTLLGAQRCDVSNGDRRTHSPSQFCTPILRLPFPPKPVNHTLSPYPSFPCEVPMSQSHPSTGAPILEIRLSQPPESRHSCSPPAHTDCHWENHPILAEDAAAPEPTEDIGSNTPTRQESRWHKRGTSPPVLPPPPNNPKPLASRTGDAMKHPGAKLVSQLGRDQAHFALTSYSGRCSMK